MQLVRNFFNSNTGKELTYYAKEVVTTVGYDLISCVGYTFLPSSLKKVASLTLLSLNGIRHLYRSGIIGRVKRCFVKASGQQQKPNQEKQISKRKVLQIAEGVLGVVEVAAVVYLVASGIRSLFIKSDLTLKETNLTLNTVTFENGSPLDRCSLAGTSPRISLKNVVVFSGQPVCLAQCEATTHHVYWYTRPRFEDDSCSRLVLNCKNALNSKGEVIETCTKVKDYVNGNEVGYFLPLKKLKVNLKNPINYENLFEPEKVRVIANCSSSGNCTFTDLVTKEISEYQLPLAPHSSITGIEGEIITGEEYGGGRFCWGSNDLKDLWHRCAWIQRPVKEGSIDLFKYVNWEEVGKNKCRLTGVSFLRFDTVSKKYSLIEDCIVTKQSLDSTILRCQKEGVNALRSAGYWARDWLRAFDRARLRNRRDFILNG